MPYTEDRRSFPMYSVISQHKLKAFSYVTYWIFLGRLPYIKTSFTEICTWSGSSGIYCSYCVPDKCPHSYIILLAFKFL